MHELSGKKLLFPANTRWNTLAITYNRVIELFDHINTISFRKSWPHIELADLNVGIFFFKIFSVYLFIVDEGIVRFDGSISQILQ